MHNLLAFVFIKDDKSEIKNLKDAIDHIESEVIDDICGEHSDYQYGTTDLDDINDRWKEYAGCVIKNCTIESETGQTILKKLIEVFKKEKIENLAEVRKILETKSDKEILNDFSNTSSMHTLSTEYDCTIRRSDGMSVSNFNELDKILASKGWIVFMDVHY